MKKKPKQPPSMQHFDFPITFESINVTLGDMSRILSDLTAEELYDVLRHLHGCEYSTYRPNVEGAVIEFYVKDNPDYVEELAATKLKKAKSHVKKRGKK